MEKIKNFIIVSLYNLIKILYFIIILFITKKPNYKAIENIKEDSIYPYDLVTTKEFYQKAINNEYKENKLYTPIVGLVIAIDSYKKENNFIIPEIVKVCYFNLCNFSIPVIKTCRAEDLIFLLSPLKEFVKLTNLALGMEQLFSELEEELEKEDSDIDPEDEGGNGPLVH